MPLKQNQIIPDTATGDRGYNYPNGNIPIGQSAHGNGLGYHPWENVGEDALASSLPGAASPVATYGPSAQDVKDIVNDISYYEQFYGGVPENIKPNSIYGYGSPKLDFMFTEDKYPYDEVHDEFDVPKNQDNLRSHFWGKGDEYREWLDNNFLTPEQQQAMADSFTALRNYNDWQNYQEAEKVAEQARNRNLYGETLYNLLSESPEGQSILGSTRMPKEWTSRERNITGKGTGGFVKE